jgi:hypothetical protein
LFHFSEFSEFSYIDPEVSSVFPSLKLVVEREEDEEKWAGKQSQTNRIGTAENSRNGNTWALHMALGFPSALIVTGWTPAF